MKGIAASLPALVSVLLVAGCASTEDQRAGDGLAVNTMACGQADIGLDYHEDRSGLTITLGSDKMVLKQKESASGARLVDPDNDGTQFWNKGDTATLTIDGQALPLCLVPGAVEKPFIARGNEPFWRAVLEPGQLVVEQMGKVPIALRYEVVESATTGRTFEAEGDGVRVSLKTASQLCRDSMTGMPYPRQVRLAVNGEESQGCGGDPERLLRGTEWVVEDIGGRGIIDSSRVTLNFLADQRVAGRASCNQFSGGWNLTGEGLEFTRMASTKKACAPALMNQEDRFLSLLGEVQRFDIGRHGELLLVTGDGPLIRAFQSTD